jgi:hypothetical protein
LEAAPPADFMDLALGLGLEWNATQPAAIVQEMS